MQRSGSFPERPLGRQRVSDAENNDKVVPDPKRQRSNYYNAGCRMDMAPVRRAKRFDATFGKKYDEADLLAHAVRKPPQSEEPILSAVANESTSMATPAKEKATIGKLICNHL
jgi:hypothetical protein